MQSVMSFEARADQVPIAPLIFRIQFPREDMVHDIRLFWYGGKSLLDLINVSVPPQDPLSFLLPFRRQIKSIRFCHICPTQKGRTKRYAPLSEGKSEKAGNTPAGMSTQTGNELSLPVAQRPVNRCGLIRCGLIRCGLIRCGLIRKQQPATKNTFIRSDL